MAGKNFKIEWCELADWECRNGKIIEIAMATLPSGKVKLFNPDFFNTASAKGEVHAIDGQKILTVFDAVKIVKAKQKLADYEDGLEEVEDFLA